MMRVAISLISLSVSVLLGGCHVIFGLEALPGDAPRGVDGDDGAMIDAPPGDTTLLSDGRLCWDPFRLDDEDGDGVKDGCDNCPAVFNIDQNLNGDQDDLGDPCDPHPGGEDRIALWHNFTSTVDSAWTQVGGAGNWQWDATGGAYAQIDGSFGGTISVYGARTFTNATVEIVFAEIRSPTTSNTATAGAYLWTDTHPPEMPVPDGVLCLERRLNQYPVNDVIQILERGGDNSVTPSGPITGARSSPTYLRVSSMHDEIPGMVACVLVRGTDVPVVTVATDPSATGYVALITGNTSARFRSVLVSELVP